MSNASEANAESGPSVNVGINGFGRIGKLLMRVILQKKLFRVVGINDPSANLQSIAHSLKYDSTHGYFQCNIEVDEENRALRIDNQTVRVFTELDPTHIPWGELGVEIVVECSGKFRTREKCQSHLDGGAKRVLLSAPPQDINIPMFVVGVNHQDYQSSMSVVSTASCTTNCLAPLAKFLHLKYGIEEGLMTTVHAMTATQKVVDGYGGKDFRSSRCATRNIIPASTGAATSVGSVLPDLDGKLSGMSFRVPVENVSVVDLTVRLKNPIGDIGELGRDIEQIEQDKNHEMHGVLGATNEPVVSSDFNGDERSCIVDLSACILLTPYFAKFIAYYDNEWAYTVRMV